jgi:1-deoxy-D-xylulose-5-phosphate synthase
MKPFCNIYSSFSHRAFDQIFHDVALQGLPVVLCLDRSGIVGEDGATHHGCYDMAVYRTLPGTVIAAPKDETELKNMMYTASLAEEGPFIIRYPRGYGEGTDWKSTKFETMEPGKGELLLKGTDMAVIAAGPSANRALEAALKIKEETGWNPSIYNIRYIKPLDTELMKEVAESYGRVITIEDGCIMGGLYGAVSEYIAQRETPIPVRAVGIPDRYISQGTQEELKEECGLTNDEIYSILISEKEKICKKDEKVLEI